MNDGSIGLPDGSSTGVECYMGFTFGEVNVFLFYILERDKFLFVAR